MRTYRRAYYEDLWEGINEDLQEGIYEDLQEGIYEDLFEGIYEDLYEGIYVDLYEGIYEDLQEGIYEDLYEGIQDGTCMYSVGEQMIVMFSPTVSSNYILTLWLSSEVEQKLEISFCPSGDLYPQPPYDRLSNTLITRPWCSCG